MSFFKKPKPFLANYVQGNKSNEDLMVDFTNGNEGAFKVIFNSFKNPIYSFIYGMVKNEGQAAELTQDVFIKVYKNKEKFDPKQKFTTWLWSIARNTTIDFIRKKDPLKYPVHAYNEDGEKVNHIDVVASLDPSQEEQLAKKSEKEAIDNCMKTLKASQEEVLRLRILSELSYEEISKTMTLSLSAVKSLLNRAKKNLLICLKGCLNEE